MSKSYMILFHFDIKLFLDTGYIANVCLESRGKHSPIFMIGRTETKLIVFMEEWLLRFVNEVTLTFTYNDHFMPMI